MRRFLIVAVFLAVVSLYHRHRQQQQAGRLFLVEFSPQPAS